MRQTAGGVIFSVYSAYSFLTEYTRSAKNMKRRPHKIVSVVLLAVLLTGMGIACRIQRLESENKRWTDNTGKMLKEERRKKAQK